MEPVSSVAFMNFVAVVKRAPHPNRTKLLIRYLLPGGGDGNEMVSEPFNSSEDGQYPETTLAEGNILGGMEGFG